MQHTHDYSGQRYNVLTEAFVTVQEVRYLRSPTGFRESCGGRNLSCLQSSASLQLIQRSRVICPNPRAYDEQQRCFLDALAAPVRRRVHFNPMACRHVRMRSAATRTFRSLYAEAQYPNLILGPNGLVGRHA